MKRILIVILTLLFTTAAIATPPKRGERQNRGPGGPEGPGGRGFLPPGAIAEFLALTDAQTAQVETLRDSLKATIEPLVEQQRANREALEAALAAGDSAKVGELALAKYNVGKQLKSARESFETSFIALLTPEQKAKWEIYQEISGLRHGRPDGPRRGGPRP